MVDDKEEGHVPFSVVELDGGTLVGAATLWDIDNHHRSAHIGLGLVPSARGKGYGTDVVAVLRHYGFVVRGRQRLQIETLSDNVAMLRSAERNGFVRESVMRSSAWVMGEFLDEVLLGLLVQDWKPDSKA
ncbi:GNAT family N-acetyltransferase [Streptosporangium sp. OZ121]|uniref:GNAT family N-acetyltransferase n=1 Tax=Streptosporangium sp. OZ121 TaxID=3444183 RepID=UPI003F791541